MKRIITILLLCLLNSFCQAQTVQSDCTPPSDSIRLKYLDGAYKLALKEILQRNDVYKDSVHIPDFWRDTILNPMMAVYNAVGLPARDTVVLGLGNAGPVYHVNYLSTIQCRIIADTNLQWVKNIATHTYPTGLTILDDYQQEYGLQFSTGIPLSNGKRNFAVYREDTFYNYFPIVADLTQIAGVENAYMLYNLDEYWESNSITDSLFSDRVLLTYTYGFGDCPSGCTYHRSWVFDVFPDCSVTFVGSYGDNLINPGAVGDVALASSVRIAPNPFQNTLSITAQNKATLRITDLLGRVWAVQELAPGSIEINTAAWPAGIYFCTVTTDNGQKGFVRVVKE